MMMGNLWMMGVMALGGAPVSGSDAAVGVLRASLDRTLAARRSTVEVRAQPHGDAVEVTLRAPSLGLLALPLGRASRGHAGDFGTLLTVPDSAPAGPHLLTLQSVAPDGTAQLTTLTLTVPAR
jgi:hypothetical protein